MLTHKIEMRHGIDSCNDGTLKGLGSQKHTYASVTTKTSKTDVFFIELSCPFFAVLVLYGVFKSNFTKIQLTISRTVAIRFPRECGVDMLKKGRLKQTH